MNENKHTLPTFQISTEMLKFLDAFHKIDVGITSSVWFREMTSQCENLNKALSKLNLDQKPVIELEYPSYRDWYKKPDDKVFGFN